MLAFASTTAEAAECNVEACVRRVVDDASHPIIRWPDFPFYQEEMQGLYAPMDYGLLWFKNGRPRKQIVEVIAILKEAKSHGLDPESYDADALEQQWRELSTGGTLVDHRHALFDTALSIALLRYISDLHIGRVNPRNLSVKLDIEPKRYDLPKLVHRAIEEDRIQETVEAAEPQLVQYRFVMEALAHYRELATDPRLEPVPATGQTLRPGDPYEGLDKLTQLLEIVGDLDRAAEVGETFDGAIVEAVKRFQQRHGLEPDGIVGRKTFAALNVPLERRVRQLELALERLRWLPDLPEGPFLVANIPGFELMAFDYPRPGGQPVFVMNVVVGKSLNTQTPVFDELMRYVVFGPYWNVPYSITVREILPKLADDPGYLERNQMEIVDRFAWDAEPYEPTPENIERLASWELRIRQRPGSLNALGRVKFIFPNSDNIYLHDTPARTLFARSRRDFSHGCIRVEDPAKLAEFVLRDVPGWELERIEQAMAAPRPQRVNLPNPLPVLIFYTTAGVRPHTGEVAFFKDIYGHDARREAALQAVRRCGSTEQLPRVLQ
ncbi:MAG: L,D-transpeptidase family protein [Acidobacteria bacterium]|nr:L,D-transpeptidase family protein [Acidobacteriota bacterium]